MTHHPRNLALDEAQDQDDVIRVSGGTDPQSIASAISNAFYEAQAVTVRAMGAGAVNQAVKGIAIARGYVATRGVDLLCRPGFINVDGFGDKDVVTAIVFRLSLR
jgi:stage V sporulation protein S